MLKNERTGATVYTPPQDHAELAGLMTNREQFINDGLSDADPLVKMKSYAMRMKLPIAECLANSISWADSSSWRD